MVRVIAQFFVRSDAVEKVRALFDALAGETLKEQGCMEYSFCVNQDDATHFILVETWASAAALETHGKTEHFGRLIPQIQECLAKDLSILAMRPLTEK